MIVTSATRVTELAARVDLPFVAWRQYLVRQAPTITSNCGVLTDGALANAVSGTTFDYWLPNVVGTNVTYSAQFATALHISFAGIVGHNLGTLGGTVRVQSSPDGATWTDAGGGLHTPTDNSPIGFRMSSDVSANKLYWRFNFLNLTPGAALYVAGLIMSEEIIFPVGIYDGFAPPISPTDVQLQSNVSVGGNLIGSSIIAQGTSLTAKLDYIPPSDIRVDLLDFIATFNGGEGFWFAWRPSTFVNDIRYCWREGATIVPVNSGGRDYMSIQMQMRAFET